MFHIKHTLFVSALLLFFTASGQSLSFSELKFDFGQIEEDGGNVAHKFKFKNISNYPVVLVSASSSCGCTTASFSKKPLSPGQYGEVTIEFNPKNYPGAVSRSVIIHTSDPSDNIRLTITAKVTPHRKSIEEQYPILLGDNLRMDLNAYTFGYVEHGIRSQSAFELINLASTNTKLELKPRMASSYLQVTYPNTIPPHSHVSINIAYDLAENCGVYGTLHEEFDIYVNGIKSIFPVYVNAIAIDRRGMAPDTEEPSIVLSENFVNFGNIDKQNILKHRLWIRNEGPGVLLIRKIEFERNRYKVEDSGQKVISPGEKAGINIIPIPDSMHFGSYNDHLRIISNDPRNPMKSIRVASVVEQK